MLVVQTMLKIAGMASDSTHWLKYLSILSAYEPESFVRVADTMPNAAWSFSIYDTHGNWSSFGPLASDLLLVGVGLASLLGAA